MLAASVLLSKPAGSSLCHHSHTRGSLPFIRVCSCPITMHITFAQDSKHACWLSAALRFQLAAALCHHSHAYASLPFCTCSKLTCVKAKLVTGVTMVAQGCCQLCLQSSNEPESLLRVSGKPAVRQCWMIEHLYKAKISMGFNRKACSVSLANLPCIRVRQLHTCMQAEYCIGITVVTQAAS